MLRGLEPLMHNLAFEEEEVYEKQPMPIVLHPRYPRHVRPLYPSIAYLGNPVRFFSFHTDLLSHLVPMISIFFILTLLGTFSAPPPHHTRVLRLSRFIPHPVGRYPDSCLGIAHFRFVE